MELHSLLEDKHLNYLQFFNNRETVLQNNILTSIDSIDAITLHSTRSV